jgi:hypothetical protein
MSSLASARPSRARSSIFGTQSLYKYINLNAATQNESFFNLNIDTSAVDSMLIAASKDRFALPWATLSAGAIYVGDLSKPGKFAQASTSDTPLLSGLKEKVSCLEFNPFDANVLASGSEDGSIVLWTLPEGGALKSSLSVDGEAATLLNAHMKGVRNVLWHPCASNVLASSSSDMSVRLWDINAQKESGSFVEVDDKVTSISWNYEGSNLVLSTRTSVLRLDGRTGSSEILLDSPHAGKGKGIKACVMRDENYVSTVGFGRMATREFKVWDVRSSGKPICTEAIDNGAGTLWPFYDADTGCVFLCAKGEATIHIFDVPSDGKALKCAPCTVAGDPLAGLAFLSKASCNVEEVEVCKALRCTGTAVQPLSFTVPRSTEMKAWFQEDLYPPTRSTTEPSMTASDFFSGKTTAPILSSLCPEGLKPVSEKPIKVVKRIDYTAKFEAERQAAAKAKELKDKEFERLQALAVQHAKFNVNKSMGGKQSKGIKVRGEYDAETDSDRSDSGWSDED